MVLKAKLGAASNPAFEQDEDTVVEVAEQAAPAAQVKPAALPVSTTSTAGAISKLSKKVNPADFDVLAQLQDRLPPVEYGEGARLVGSNGNVMDEDKLLLGGSITLNLLSWNNRYVVSPGENGEKAKEFARYSLDGVTTSKGEDVKTYLHNLQTVEGFGKASVKTYLDLFGILEASEKLSKHLGAAVTVSLAPDSVKAFNGLRRDMVVKGMLGSLPDNLGDGGGLSLTITTEVKSGNGNTWTRLIPKLA